MQRAPALRRVWGRVSVASLTPACAMRGDRDSNPGPSGHRRLNYIGIHGAKENLSIGLEFEPGAMNRKLILSVPWSLPKHGPDRGSHAMLMRE